ncbi:hypothetical protein P3T76_000309 [Phytophthora citrophthora]|uniref:Uncharacterized protein n=1 Tax=Phytophthora citrophthora TaxID=4793 RepID=A0AAD9H0D1_9STRA|nr:hypothetical protein P3T76_000309 [Phytophthora citrophthora]
MALWSLVCLLSEKKLTTQAMQCLEPLCALDCSTRSIEEQETLLQANILLAELCSVVCSNSRKADDRDLWARRVTQTEKCIYSADAAIARQVPCSNASKLRLVKAKFLLQQQLKSNRVNKDKRMLEILCEGLKSCAEIDDQEIADKFRKYFGVKLKACLVKMHAATTMAKGSDNGHRFAENLKYLRTSVSNYVDKMFLLWLVEVTCHTAIASFQQTNTTEIDQLVVFGQEFFDKVVLEQPVSSDFRIHHLIITGFYYLRIEKRTKVAPLLDQVETLIRGSGGESGQKSIGMKETYLKTILDSIRVIVTEWSDPNAARDLAMNTILAAQANLKVFAQHSAVRSMLIATLFDMLHVYCRLLGVQCRYTDMGFSILQMTALFATYRPELERTMFYRVFLARCHTLIAKYATAIGKVKDAIAHLNYIVNKVLPAPTTEDTSYSDAYLDVWVDVLDTAMYCCGVATQPSASDGNGVQIKQIYPSRVLLEWVAKVLKSDGLKHHVKKCCSLELRAKYDLALAKWMWATEMMSIEEKGNAATTSLFTRHVELEDLRPKAIALLSEALEHMNSIAPCCEATSEVMVLFGPQLVAFGKVQEGEEMLATAIQTSTQSKNVLLQTRLLATVFEIYTKKRLDKARATAASKYEKKLAVLQRRIAAAQAEEATTNVLLRWTAGSCNVNKSTPSRG